MIADHASPQDRREYEEYLAANPKDAAALTEFAGLPAILNALSPGEALALNASTGEAGGGDEASGLSAATVIPTSQIRRIDIRVAGTDAPLAVTTLR